MRCPYCSNWNLRPTIHDTRLICDQLVRLRRSVDYVTVSGGEPLAQVKAVATILRCARRLGYKIGLQTSGATGRAARFAVLGLVDAVMLDLKAVPSRYPEICGCGHDAPLLAAKRFAALRADRRIEAYETRTVVFRGLSDTLKEIRVIAKYARGSDSYTIVGGRADLAPPGTLLEEVSREQLLALGAAAKKMLPDTRVYVNGRGGKEEIKEAKEVVICSK
jgi:pyruvate-formate lyase-activating enzyme